MDEFLNLYNIERIEWIDAQRDQFEKVANAIADLNNTITSQQRIRNIVLLLNRFMRLLSFYCLSHSPEPVVDKEIELVREAMQMVHMDFLASKKH